jgi:hypothetical protein
LKQAQVVQHARPSTVRKSKERLSVRFKPDPRNGALPVRRSRAQWPAGTREHKLEHRESTE